MVNKIFLKGLWPDKPVLDLKSGFTHWYLTIKWKEKRFLLIHLFIPPVFWGYPLNHKQKVLFSGILRVDILQLRHRDTDTGQTCNSARADSGGYWVLLLLEHEEIWGALGRFRAVEVVVQSWATWKSIYLPTGEEVLQHCNNPLSH